MTDIRSEPTHEREVAITHPGPKQETIDAIKAEVRRLETMTEDTAISNLIEEVRILEEWVADLQSGMFVNCVYCGHRYGPKQTTPVSMADVLRAHVEKCPKHPMSALKRQKEALEAALRVAEKALDIARGIGEEDGPCSCPSCQQVRDALRVVREALGGNDANN